MNKLEMKITLCPLEVDLSWLTMPVFTGALVLITFIAIAVALWNAADPDEDDETYFDD